MAIIIDPIELLALKKLSIVCAALASKISGSSKLEQQALTRVLVDVCVRAELDNEAILLPTRKVK